MAMRAWLDSAMECPMPRLIYAAWFRDTALLPEDEDSEWVACIAIEADSEQAAQEWGDHLAKAMCGRHPEQEFLSSEVSAVDDPMYADTDVDGLPHVRCGEDVTDEEVGW